MGIITTRTVTGLAVGGLAAGLAFTGISAATASPATPSPAAPSPATPSSAAPSSAVILPSSGVLEQRLVEFCRRAPDRLVRLDKAQTRIAGDADTEGSLAWLAARKAQAETKNHKRVVKRIDRRIERHAKRLAKLPELKTKLTAAGEECTMINLPDSSGS